LRVASFIQTLLSAPELHRIMLSGPCADRSLAFAQSLPLAGFTAGGELRPAPKID